MNLPACQHRGEVSGEAVECRSNRLMHRGTVPMSFCQTCRYADVPLLDIAKLAPPDRSCIHRGDHLRRQECDGCGMRKQLVAVFACALHGECTLHKAHSQIRGCAACPDRQSP